MAGLFRAKNREMIAEVELLRVNGLFRRPPGLMNLIRCRDLIRLIAVTASWTRWRNRNPPSGP